MKINLSRFTLVLVIISSLACSTITRVFTNPTPTATFVPATVAPGTETPAPQVYVPPECQNIPFATVPVETALAAPTPYLQGNPEVSQDLQLRVFEEVVGIIEEVYVYPDFNGLNWDSLVAQHRTRIEGGLNTEAFYTEMQTLINELGDEHSALESPVEVAYAESELAGSNDFVGIGIYYLPMVEKQRISILSVFPNSPAAHSGLKPHDSILTVDGLPIVRNGEEISYLVTGPECTAVVLTVQSPGEGPREMTLVRQRIQSPTLIEARLVATSDGSRIGYIFLPTFYDETIPGQVHDALENFGALDGLILDNRMNGGGSSSVLEPILAYFASGVLGEYTSRSDTRDMEIDPDPVQNSQAVPLVVLVGRDTASFGEVFSGVLRDAGRAKIIGEATFGNVEVLHGYGLPDGSRLWIAAETFTPRNSQVNWEETGIVPDVQAYADWDTFTFESDPAVAAALTLLGH
ncbi:MAG: S41 family peptidase [Chloroflexota bacterium]